MRIRRNSILFWLAVGAFLAAARLCHKDLLWPDEDYHLATAIQILNGKTLYRDLWYDKPPLSALMYALLGAPVGWWLRIFDALFAWGCCWLAFRFAAHLWSRREGFIAAGLLAFFLVFDAPSAVIALAPDTLLLAPHFAAIYLAWRRRPLFAGLVCGVAFSLNTKAAFVLAASAVFGLAGWPLLAIGFLLPNLIAMAWLGWNSAVSEYFAQVWRWGLLYAADPDARVTVGRGLLLLLNWAWLHALLLIGSAWFWWREKDANRRRLGLWAAISLISVTVGWRFYPQYFIQLLPPLILAGARGISSIVAIENRRARVALTATLAITAIVVVARFHPLRTAKDNEMGRDSKDAARLIDELRQPGDSIFVWGSRPDIIARTRLPLASGFGDAQPLTGAPSNRHLRASRSLDPEWARENRRELARSRPSILVDGLSGFNPDLDVHNYAELAEWIAQYCLAASTGRTAVYRLCAPH